LENNRPFIKMAFQGFAGDGKTYTAVQCAIGLHKQIGSKLPIAIFDTEKAAKALVGVFADAGIECVVDDEHRSLKALNEAIAWCENGGADILVIDSITHVWEEFLKAYMDQKRRTRLEFQDWGVIKPQWKQQFSTPFVKAKIHIFFTGRAGYEYETEKDEQTGKREIHKSGIKMKAETETAFEPDVLVLMEKHQDVLGDTKKITRVATVLKDRTTRTDGKTFVNPTYADFKPAFSCWIRIPRVLSVVCSALMWSKIIVHLFSPTGAGYYYQNSPCVSGAGITSCKRSAANWHTFSKYSINSSVDKSRVVGGRLITTPSASVTSLAGKNMSFNMPCTSSKCSLFPACKSLPRLTNSSKISETTTAQ